MRTEQTTGKGTAAMTTGARMKQRRKELGISVEAVAAALGVSVATVYRYEKGDIEKVPGALLEPLARVLHTTPAYLMGWAASPAAGTVPPGFDPLPETTMVPRVGEIACGEPILAEQNIETYDCVPKLWRADFTLACHGDSMEPCIKDGDVVAVRRTPNVENGEIAAVRIDDEATLKHVYRYPDRLVLQPENPAFPPIVLIGEEINRVVIEGRAVGLCRSL